MVSSQGVAEKVVGVGCKGQARGRGVQAKGGRQVWKGSGRQKEGNAWKGVGNKSWKGRQAHKACAGSAGKRGKEGKAGKEKVAGIKREGRCR